MTNENSGDGIEIGGESFVTGNHSRRNGNGGDGAGIHVTGFGTRVEENHVSNNDRGIDVDAGGNLIIKNSASGNATDYDLAGTNTVGVIVTATGTISADPWANFSF